MKKRRCKVIYPPTVSAIQERLARGESHDAISRAVGVSPNTIHRIARGTHVSQRQVSPYQTCPKCRSKVLLPCLACQLRR